MEKGTVRFIVLGSFLELLCSKAGTKKIVLKEIIRNCRGELIFLP
jgi:hypothetical protein